MSGVEALVRDTSQAIEVVEHRMAAYGGFRSNPEEQVHTRHFPLLSEGRNSGRATPKSPIQNRATVEKQ
jgi:hypothetical protein